MEMEDPVVILKLMVLRLSPYSELGWITSTQSASVGPISVLRRMR